MYEPDAAEGVSLGVLKQNVGCIVEEFSGA